MKQLKAETFIAGNVGFYTLLVDYPDLIRVPMTHYDMVKSGLKNMGYKFRIRYRGPRGRSGEAPKATARAFTVYFQ